MLDQDAAHLALRARARSLIVCTTGVMDLEATATGYARQAGSFATDGFYVGMEIVPAGFGDNPIDTVIDVDDLTLTTASGRRVEGSAGGRSLTVGIPSKRAWEDIDFTPVAGDQYIDEEWLPATGALTTASAQGGNVEETGFYYLKWYYPSGTGGSGLRRSIDALKALFASGTAFRIGSADLRVPGRPVGPVAGQIRQAPKGGSYVQLSVPWLAESINMVAP